MKHCVRSTSFSLIFNKFIRYSINLLMALDSSNGSKVLEIERSNNNDIWINLIAALCYPFAVLFVLPHTLFKFELFDFTTYSISL